MPCAPLSVNLLSKGHIYCLTKTLCSSVEQCRTSFFFPGFDMHCTESLFGVGKCAMKHGWGRLSIVSENKVHFQGATFGCFRSFISACFVTKTLMRIPVFSCFFPSLTSSHQIAFYYLLLSVFGCGWGWPGTWAWKCLFANMMFAGTSDAPKHCIGDGLELVIDKGFKSQQNSVEKNVKIL